jgi:F420-non-reducing hydrogenase iron-sulfur subunit
MTEVPCPDIVVYVCRNCIPGGGHLPRQWDQNGAHVCVREIPCSGKIDGQYLMHTLEAGGYGVCVVTCPKGECRLAQGNYRAEVRVRTAQRLLAETGLEQERVELLRSSPDGVFEEFERAIREAAQRLCDLGRKSIPTQT